MRKFTLTTALTALALPAMAEDAALLLGVERYQNLGRISNADDIAGPDGLVEAAGYSVSAQANGSARDTRRLLRDFVADAENADRLVVGLAGRFVTDGDRTWFLAADARTPTLFDLHDTAVSVESLVAVLAQTPGHAILVLGRDAGEDDSINAYLTEGLGPIDAPQGVTVLVAEPRYADDILTDAIIKPEANVMSYARNSRRISALGFQPDRLVMQRSDEAAPSVTVRPTVDPTLKFWNDAQEANGEDSYREFVLNYPQSQYAPEARRRLDALENDPIRRAERTEDALNLNRNARRAVQRNLTLLDYNTRGVDGIFGPGSRGAIRNWQQSNGFEQTSYLTREQISRIDAQASRRKAEIEAEQERAREEALRLDRAYWDETGAQGDVAGYQAYLERYPKGIFAKEAKEELDKLTGRQQEQEAEEQNQENNQNQNQQARQQERRLNINPILARLIESRLSQLGFNPGTVDGRFDSDTRGAIARYQTRRNLPATGYLSEPTLARLLADTF